MHLRTLVLLPLPALTVAVALSFGTAPTSRASTVSEITTNVVIPVPSVEPTEPPVLVTPKPSLPEPNPILVQYLNDSAVSWTHLPDCSAEDKTDEEAKKAKVRCDSWETIERETADQTRARIQNIAEDIAQAAAVEASPYKNDPHSARMANLVASVAFYESRFRGYVDDGRCNDRKWQGTPEGIHFTRIGGNCDSSNAHSLWQIHISRAWMLTAPTKANNFREVMSTDNIHDYESHTLLRWKLEKEDETLPSGFKHIVRPETITGSEHRLLAARTAWHMLSQSLRDSNFTNICSYTGEQGYCPKGETRLGFADKWWKEHPISFPTTP
jgi:hypothetical protein